MTASPAFLKTLLRIAATWLALAATVYATDCGCDGKVKVLLKQQGHLAGTVLTTVTGGGVNRTLPLTGGPVHFDAASGLYYADQSDMACAEWGEEVELQLTIGEPVAWTSRWSGDRSSSSYTKLDANAAIPLLMFAGLPDATCLRFLVDLDGTGTYVPLEEGVVMYPPPSDATEFTWHLKVEMGTPPVNGVLQCSAISTGLEKDGPNSTHFQNPVPLGMLCEEAGMAFRAQSTSTTTDSTSGTGAAGTKRAQSGLRVPTKIRHKGEAGIDLPSTTHAAVRARLDSLPRRGAGVLTAPLVPDASEADAVVKNSQRSGAGAEPGALSANVSGTAMTTEATTVTAASAPAGVTPGAYLARSIGALHLKLTLGTSVGSLIYETPAIDAGAYSPARLRFDESARPEVIYRDAQGSLKQALFPTGLLDISTIDPLHFAIRFYSLGQFSDAGGSFTITDDHPAAQWLVENPDAVPAGHLRFTGTRNGVTDVHLASWRAAAGGDAGQMTVSMYNDTVVEQTTYFLSLASTPTRTERIKRWRGASGPVEDDRSDVYGEFYYWGAAGEVFEAVIQRTLDPDGAALSTLYGYYDQTSQPGGQLSMIIYPDGYWEAYSRYSGNGDLAATFRPWVDAPASPFVATAANSVVTSVTYEYPDPNTETRVSDTIWSNSVRFGYNTFTRQVGVSDYTETTQTWLTNSLSTLRQTVNNGVHGSLKGNYEVSGILRSYNNAWGYWDPIANTYHFDQAPGRIVAQRVIALEGTPAQTAGIPNRTTVTLRYVDAYRRPLLEETYVNDGQPFFPGIRTDWIGQHVWSYDSRGLLLTEKINGRIVFEASYDADGLRQWTKDELGIRTNFTYDRLNRVAQSTRLASGSTPEKISTFTYDATGRVITQVVTAGTGADAVTQTTSFHYDRAGRLDQTTTPDGLTMASVETILVDGGGLPARRQLTVTNPDGSQEIVENYRDRRLFRRYGSAVPAEYWGYGLTSLGYSLSTSFHDLAATQLRGQRITDWAGNLAGEILPGFTGQSNFVRTYTYGVAGAFGTVKGLLVSTTEPGIAPRLFEYDELGQLAAEGLDLDGNGLLDRTGLDLVSLTDFSYIKGAAGEWSSVQKISRLEADNSASSNLISETREQLSGLPATTISSTDSLLTGAERFRTTVVIDRANATRVTAVRDLAADLASSPTILTEIGGLLQTLRSADAAADVVYTYDAVGRPRTVLDPLTGTTIFSYDANGRLKSTIDTLLRETQFTYYLQGQAGAGKVATTRDAAGKTTYFAYNARGRLWRQWGENIYPQELTYNDDDQVTGLRTFRTTDAPALGGVDWSTAIWPAAAPTGDLTQWVYHFSGLLDRKRYADATETVYNYDSARRLASKKNARLQTVSYGYNSLGGISTKSYSSGSLATDCAYTYDRAGRVRTITDGSGLRTYTYDPASGKVATETYGTGLLSGKSITRTYDAFGRLDLLSIPGVYTADWNYDSLNRVNTVAGTAGSILDHEVKYVRESGNSRFQDIEWRNASVLRLRGHRTYDNAGRLTTADTFDGSAVLLDRNGYAQFDALNRRLRVDREDGGRWDYSYDARGEVTSAVRSDSASQALPGHQFGYNFDTVGNRLTSSRGSQTSSYLRNSLNQYTQRTVPGMIGVVGTAATGTLVTADFQSTTRQGPWFSTDLTVNNGPAAVWKQFDVVAVKSNAGPNGEDDVAAATRTAFVAKTPENFSYDLDGNLTGDGRWTYTWDAENCLVAVETNPAAIAVGAPRVKVEFSYDVAGRRVLKKRSTWSGTAWVVAEQSACLFDGWNMVAEFDVTSALNRSYLWGVDVSGDSDGAGGVGGLLLVVDGNGTHAPWYDGNGNVTGYSSTGTGQIEAHYSYGPFGESVSALGPLAGTFGYRFSSKFFDSETGLIYYGLRHYSPQLGRWISRDGAGEMAGVNLFGFVDNLPTGLIDPLGERGVDGYTAVGKGHHLFPVSLWEEFGFSPEIAKYLDTGDQLIPAPDHNYTGHGKTGYNGHVKDEFQRFLEREGKAGVCIKTEADQLELVKKFMGELRTTKNPYIAGFNRVVGQGPDAVEKWWEKTGQGFRITELRGTKKYADFLATGKAEVLAVDTLKLMEKEAVLVRKAVVAGEVAAKEVAITEKAVGRARGLLGKLASKAVVPLTILDALRQIKEGKPAAKAVVDAALIDGTANAIDSAMNPQGVPNVSEMVKARQEVIDAACCPKQ
jgi:RHS repeat-associated protein